MAVGFVPLNTAAQLPHFARLSSRTGLAAFGVAVLVIFVVFPVCNLCCRRGARSTSPTTG